MPHPLTSLAAVATLATELQRPQPLETLLRSVVERAAEALGTQRVSVRLLGDDDALLATCRAGGPLHAGEGAQFQRGEGLVGWVAAHGASLITGNAPEDPRYVDRPGQLAPLGSFVGVPLFDEEETIGVIAAVDDSRDRFADKHEQLLTVVAALCGPRLSMARLERLARLDALTSALNRHGLRRTMRTSAAAGDGMSLVMVDLDHFKRVNDTYGHAAGDEVLRAVADALRASLRGGDSVARYGGEEFLLVLPNTGRGAAMRVAERARRAVAALRFTAGDRSYHVTLSAGVAERQEGERHEAAIGRADAALYQAKARGRDQVVAAD